MEFLLPFLLLVLPSPALSSQDLPSGTQRTSRDVKPQPIKVIITDTCAQDGAKGREIDLDPDTPLVLTHQIRLVPGSGQGCGLCEVDIVAMRERIERLEKELSDLREKCGSPEGCCKSQQSKGKGRLLKFSLAVENYQCSQINYDSNENDLVSLVEPTFGMIIM